MKKILIVSSKWPLKNDTFDGGNITVKQVVESLRYSCVVDMLYFSPTEPHARYDAFGKVYLAQGNFLDYSIYAKKGGEKFNSRIRNSRYTSEKIIELLPYYDKIVIIHCQFLFGLENLKESDLRKIVLFPMFLTPSYNESGDYVPSKYYEYEKIIMSKVSNIITPSEIEQKQLIEKYNIQQKVIKVIPRIVDDIILKVHTEAKNPLAMLYIAAIRKQKNYLIAMKLVHNLLIIGINVRLDCVGPIQDTNIFTQCQDYIKKYHLGNNIIFKGVVKHSLLMSNIHEYDFNISVSAFETFGRGVIEGFASGLPTIVLLNSDYQKQNHIKLEAMNFVYSLDEMLTLIVELANNKQRYENNSRNSIDEGMSFSSNKLKEQLIRAILK